MRRHGLWLGILGDSREGRESRGASLLDDFSTAEIWITKRPNTGFVSAEIPGPQMRWYDYQWQRMVYIANARGRTA
jgi:hypothetical protein